MLTICCLRPNRSGFIICLKRARASDLGFFFNGYINMQLSKNIRQKILQSKDIAIACHINPDGDSIGSMLSLGLGLEKLGKRVYMVSCGKVPKRYKLLPGARRIIRNLTKPVDLAISVDCSDKNMLGEAAGIFDNATSVLEIDHHLYRNRFGDIQINDPKAAAVGEMIYSILKQLKVEITQEIALNILTSIIVETNSFRLPKVRPFTFEVCADLIRSGIDFHRLVEMVFWAKSKEAVLLLGRSLSRSKFIGGNKIIWSIVKQNDLSQLKAMREDADAIIEEMRSINKVEIAVLFKEENARMLRVSLRSRGRINIGKLAASRGGGGHFDAAGCEIPNNRKAISGFLQQTVSSLSKG